MSGYFTRANLVLLIGVVVAIGFCAAAVGISKFRLFDEALRPEFIKAALALGAGTWVGVVVKLLLDYHSQEREAKKARGDFIRQALFDLESVFERIETAFMLIYSHRSVKSYHDEMEKVLIAHADLNGIKRRVETDKSALGEKMTALNTALHNMSRCLTEIWEEYKEHYKDVSKLSLPVPSDPVASEANVAMGWEKLTKGDHQAGGKLWFPKTLAFIFKDKEDIEYKNFLTENTTAINVLRNKIGLPSIPPDR
jgi:hypothetical protein